MSLATSLLKTVAAFHVSFLSTMLRISLSTMSRYAIAMFIGNQKNQPKLISC